MFDRPLHRDWLVWLSVPALVLAVTAGLDDPAIDLRAGTLAAVVDTALLGLTSWIVLVAIPVGVRSGVRLLGGRRAPEQAERGGAPAS